MNKWKKYLFWFAHEHVDFRVAEMLSIFNIFNIRYRSILKPVDHPFWIIELASENDARQIASRSVSLRFCIELWSCSKETKSFHERLTSYTNEHLAHFANNSFKIVVETFNKHFTQKEKVEKIETFTYLPFKGPVNLKNPETIYFYIEFYGIDPNISPEEPVELFFGRWISDGQRNLVKKISLKTRKFIGNTSMDPLLSIIMANQARVKPGDIVFDPFVGTGSLLIPAAMFGGYTMGSDIDYLMLHGRTRPSRISQKVREDDESVAANMNQYGIASNFLDVVVSDFSRPLWRSELQLDAIITDPPYGIREAVERLGTIKINPTIEEHQVDTHIPSKIVYDLCQLFGDLLSFAAKHLKITGCLVFWFPIFREQYSQVQLPVHPCLRLIANSEQVLSAYTSRRLLTYKKMREPEPDDEACAISGANFRDQYFNMRDELRSVKRTRKSEERARMKKEWESRKNGEIR